VQSPVAAMVGFGRIFSLKMKAMKIVMMAMGLTKMAVRMVVVWLNAVMVLFGLVLKLATMATESTMMTVPMGAK
jgi:hypothetical protein